MSGDSMIAFTYQNARGEVSRRVLEHYAEAGFYLRGFDPSVGAVRTFRKDRIVEYLDAAELALSDPHPAPPPQVDRRAPPDRRLQIVFTGFAAAQRTHLEARADTAGLRVVKGVTKKLKFLCGGPNAGPKKLERAREQRVYVITQAEFLELADTGVLPDHAVDEVM